MVDSISYLNKFDDDIGGNVVDVQLYIEETLMGPIKLPEGEIKNKVNADKYELHELSVTWQIVASYSL